MGNSFLKLAGALMGQKTQKGVFITTSTFTKEAREYAGQIGSKILLMDGSNSKFETNELNAKAQRRQVF